LSALNAETGRQNKKSHIDVRNKKHRYFPMINPYEGVFMKRCLAHSVWECKYHIVWVAKNRNMVSVAETLKIHIPFFVPSCHSG
jgi:hypothetical protein